MSDRPLALYADPEADELAIGTPVLERAGLEVKACEPCSAEELLARVAELQPVALLVTYARAGEPILAAAPSIRIISCSSVGYDHVDVPAATRAGVWVANVPDAATEEVATHALAMALALERRLPFLDRHVRDGGWSYDAAGVPRRVSELTLGVIGMGRIGRRLAQLGGGLFAEVIGHDPMVDASRWPEGVRRESLQRCLSESDVLSLHAPLTGDNVHLINTDTLAAMRPGACLVNVSRGGLIDQRALLSALDEGRLAGAALDVTDPEPPARTDAIRHHPRVLVTPHSAFHSAAAAEAYVVRQAQNVVAWQRSGRPTTPVNEPR